MAGEVLTAEQLNAIAKQSGYTGGNFSNAGLPTTNAASTPIANYTPSYTPTTPTGALPTGNTTTPPVTTPEDQKLLAMGITPDQLKGLNTPEGLDPTSFQNLIGNVTTKLKTNNELVTQRGYLMKQLYDHPLTPEEAKALPEDLQRVVASGDKDTIELQMRLLNDQIAGRANTLSQSIKYLADSYQTHVKDVEDSRNSAIGTVVDFVGQYGSKAPEVLSSLYGPEYLAKLKAMGIDVGAMSKISTLAQDKEARLAADTSNGTDTFTQTQLNKGASNAGASLDEFKALPYKVKNYLINSYSNFASDLSKIASGDLTVQEVRDNINGSPTLEQSVKDYLNSILDKKYPKKASSPSFLNTAEKAISDTASGAWSEIKSWFGK